MDLITIIFLMNTTKYLLWNIIESSKAHFRVIVTDLIALTAVSNIIWITSLILMPHENVDCFALHSTHKGDSKPIIWNGNDWYKTYFIKCISLSLIQNIFETSHPSNTKNIPFGHTTLGILIKVILCN